MNDKSFGILLLASLLAGVCAPAATLYVDAGSTNPIAPYTNWLTAAAVIQDAVDAAVAGDEVVVTNGVYGIGGRALFRTDFEPMTNRVAVDKPISLRSASGPEFTAIQGMRMPEGGITPSGFGIADGAIRCAYLAAGATLSGFTLTNGGTVSDVNSNMGNGGGVFCETTSALVTNCVFVGNFAVGEGGGVWGGTLNNCIFVGNLASWGGGASASALNSCTITNNQAQCGGGAVAATLRNCILTSNVGWWLGGGAFESTLFNCTLNENDSGWEGGGADSSTLNNCILAGNTGTEGGGAYGGVLDNCLLTGNSADTEGGGAHSATLNNCTVVGNMASDTGGGVCLASLSNCIVGYNDAWDGGDYAQSTLNYCCTMPLPTDGIGNIALQPRFVDLIHGDLRLRSDSPCINAGNNAYVSGSTGLDGRPRIVGAGVDMGAYEYQGEFTNWLAQFSLPTDGTADFTDLDGDGFNNYQEYRCGTDPTNALSALRLLPPAPAGTNLTLAWPSATGRSYVLECSTNLGATPPFFPLATNLPGQPGATRFTVTNPAAWGPNFYRVFVP